MTITVYIVVCTSIRMVLSKEDLEGLTDYEQAISVIQASIDRIKEMSEKDLPLEETYPEIIGMVVLEKKLIERLSTIDKLKVKVWLLEIEIKFYKEKIRRLENDAA